MATTSSEEALSAAYILLFLRTAFEKSDAGLTCRLARSGKRSLDDDTLSNFIQNFEKIPMHVENLEFPDMLGEAALSKFKGFVSSQNRPGACRWDYRIGFLPRVPCSAG